MKRWEATEFGDPTNVLHLNDVDVPEPAPGEALVRVLTASLALPDVMMVRGTYLLTPIPPVSPGQEVVGIVERVTQGFPHPVGARIVGNSRFDAGAGGLAEYTLVPGWSAMSVMDGLTDEEAVGFSGSFQLAHIGLRHRADLQTGETLLVLGGAGRTGSAAIQVGKAMGARVIATARTEATAEFCLSQGADHVVELGRASAKADILELTQGHGVDVLYDTVGGQPHTHAATTLASSGARVLLAGFASGQMAALDSRDVLFRDYSVSGVLSKFRNDGERDETTSTLSAMLASGQISPPLTSVHSFAHVPEALAHRAIASIGQSVVTVSPADLRHRIDGTDINS